MKITQGFQCPGLCWPKKHQQLLLRFLFCEPAEARAAWEKWSKDLDLDLLDATELRLMPLAYERLVELRIESKHLAILKGSCRKHWVSNQVLIHQSMAAADILLENNVPLLVLKGLAMFEYYGTNVGVRPMYDVDFLVPLDRVQRAVDLLFEQGFGLKPAITLRRLQNRIQNFHAWGFRKGDAEIDLHWRALVEDLFEGADRGFWRRAQERELYGRPVKVLCPTDQLLHVCVHGARWSPQRFGTWAADAMKILRHSGPAIDWQIFVKEAHERLVTIPTHETLRFLAEVLGAEIPTKVLRSLRPKRATTVQWVDYFAWGTDPSQQRGVVDAAKVYMEAARRTRRGRRFELPPWAQREVESKLGSRFRVSRIPKASLGPKSSMDRRTRHRSPAAAVPSGWWDSGNETE